MGLGEILGGLGAITLGALLGYLTPLKKQQPAPVPVPVRDDEVKKKQK